MEPESSSPYPQVTATRPYPEPTPSSPHDPLQHALPISFVSISPPEYSMLHLYYIEILCNSVACNAEIAY